MRLGPIVARFIESSRADPGFMDHVPTTSDPVLRPDDLIRLALDMPGGEPGFAYGRSDVRLKGKIFLAFFSDNEMMLKLDREHASYMTQVSPETCSRVGGAWGNTGWIRMKIGALTMEEARDLIEESWQNVRSSQRRAASSRKID